MPSFRWNLLPLDSFADVPDREIDLLTWLLPAQFADVRQPLAREQASGKGVTIIEVAERCQDPSARGPTIRPSSPRSVEALLRSGIDPEDLVHKPLSFFKGKTEDTELAQESFSFFEDGRQKRLEEVKALRQTLIDDGWTASMPVVGPSKTTDDNGAADLVERERKRLEVLKNRYASNVYMRGNMQMPAKIWLLCLG